MCAICGCSDDSGFTLTSLGGAEKRKHVHGNDPGHEHDHPHEEGHPHEHDHDHPLGHGHDHARGDDPPHDHALDHFHSHTHDNAQAHARAHGKTIALEHAVMAKNDHAAAHNRAWLARRGVLALNLVSGPGAGKTTLLERTLTELKNDLSIGVIEGDQETLNDAERIRATGCRAVQINTGAGCHLDAEMVARGLESLAPADGSVVMIENVGNLVCPALFDLGERARVVVLSVTEGEDKPLKYPHMFRSAQLMLLNKIDLLPHLRFDVDACVAYARRVNPGIVVMHVSATSGEGMERWYGWLRQQVTAARQLASALA